MSTLLKKPRPEAGCVRCARAYVGPVERSVMCFRPNAQGIPCGGRITWRGNADDWTECPDCAGSGTQHQGACRRCNGDGWLMGRH